MFRLMVLEILDTSLIQVTSFYLRSHLHNNNFRAKQSPSNDPSIRCSTPARPLDGGNELYIRMKKRVIDSIGRFNSEDQKFPSGLMTRWHCVYEQP